MASLHCNTMQVFYPLTQYRLIPFSKRQKKKRHSECKSEFTFNLWCWGGFQNNGRGNLTKAPFHMFKKTFPRDFLMPLIFKETTPFQELHLICSAFKNCSYIHSFAVGHVSTTEDKTKASFKHSLLISSNCHFSTCSTHITILHML